MLQADIVRLMEELDNIANSTSFNGKMLLSGGFINQEFQVGDRSNITVKATVGSTQSSKLGVTRFETGKKITAAANVTGLVIKNYDGLGNDYNFGTMAISYSAGTGLGIVAEEFNKASGETGVRANFIVRSTSMGAITGGKTAADFTINGVSIGEISYQANDKNGALVNAINAVKDTTGVTAALDGNGRLVLDSADGRGIYLTGTAMLSAGGLGLVTAQGLTEFANFGRLSLTKNSGSDILLSAGGAAASAVGYGLSQVAQYSMSLRETKGSFTVYQADAMGFYGDHYGMISLKMTNAQHSNAQVVQGVAGGRSADKETAGVTTLKGAMAVMSIAETAILNVDQIRADIGSVQQQIDSTINNISTTQVNLKSAESVIRDLDFADESANYSKSSILAQSGAYALAQANASSQYVMQLLQ